MPHPHRQIAAPVIVCRCVPAGVLLTDMQQCNAWLQEALTKATQAAEHEQMAQQMAELERYAATTEQLFSSCAAVGGAAVPQADGDALAPPPLHAHALAPGCAMPVPEGAVEVAAGAAVSGGDGQPCVRVPCVTALQPFLKVPPPPPSPQSLPGSGPPDVRLRRPCASAVDERHPENCRVAFIQA